MSWPELTLALGAAVAVVGCVFGLKTRREDVLLALLIVTVGGLLIAWNLLLLAALLWGAK